MINKISPCAQSNNSNNPIKDTHVGFIQIDTHTQPNTIVENTFSFEFSLQQLFYR